MPATTRETTSSLVLPRGTRLLHVGPHKTGTTTVQRAFHQHRADVEAQGVHYAGRSTQPMWEVLSLLGAHNPARQIGAPTNLRPWRRLVREVHRSRAERVVISSEFFADATEPAVDAAAQQLGVERLHVVVTLRPLARILPSQWQQYVKSGMTTSYDAWLKAMFLTPETTRISPTFWQRHRHDHLVQRWADAVGADHLTVVVLDPHDHDQVLRTFEGMTGLAPSTLDVPPEAGNRSLTLAETELVRHYNRQLRKAGLTKELQHQSIRFGAAPFLQLREPGPDEPRITTPRWALEAAGARGAEMATAIAASGVRVLGSLDLLSETPSGGRADGQKMRTTVPVEVAARAALGVMHASALPELYMADPPRPPFVRRITTRRLLTLVRHRVAALLRRGR